MNRRNFMKIMAASAAFGSSGLNAYTLEHADAATPEQTETKKIRSACRNCYGRCGIEGTIENGRVVKIDGVSEVFSEGTLCGRAFAIPHLMYSPMRLRYPILRVGERGEGKWKKISWEDALNLIAKNYREIINKHGAHTLVHQYGAERDLSTLNVISRLFNELGSTSTFGSSSRRRGLYMTSRLIYGDEAQCTGWDGDNTKCLILWSRQEDSYGHYDWLVMERAKERGVKVIAVDPRYTVTASKADMWLPIRPTSDMALVLTFINQIISSDRYDKEFVKKWTTGPFLVKDDGMFLRERDIVQGGSATLCAYWDDKTSSIRFWDEKEIKWDSENPEPAILGAYSVGGKSYKTSFQILSDSLKEWTPKKAAEITWLPENKIKEAANQYIFNSPGAAFACGQSIENGTNSSGITHGLAIMMALAGNVDVKGGQNMARANSVEKISGEFSGSYAVTTKATSQGAPLQAKAYFGMASEQILSFNGVKEIIESFKNLEFSVNVDLFMTPTGEYCDMVLPAAHPSEVDRVELAHLGHSYPASHTALIRQPFSAPLGESRDDIDILFDIAKRMNVNIGWKDKYDLYDFMLRPVQIDFEKFREKKFIISKPDYKRFEKGKLRGDGKEGFPTSNGKFNLYSEDMLKYGFGAVPTYKEQPMTPISSPELLKEYPYIVITGRHSHAYFNSEYRQSPWMREQHPFPTVQLNTETAKKHGIINGDWVYIETNIGRCKQRAEITNSIHPQMVHVEHGWWFPEKEATDDMHGAFECNSNELFRNVATYDTAVGSDCNSGLCKIYKASDGMPKNIYSAPEQLEAFLPKQ